MIKDLYLSLFALVDWWPALGVIPILLGLLAAWRHWKENELPKCREQIKELKKDNARLTREALIRIDDLQDCYQQIDRLQTIVVEGRKRSQDLIDLAAKDETSNSNR